MTREPAENGALRQLQSEQLELLDVIDELRTIGLGRIVELPQLIVCGNQSSGKSSVLEAISRVRFPAKGNVCTRFATEVILRRSPSPRIKVAIEPGPSRVDERDRDRLLKFTSEKFGSGKDLPQLIEAAKECIGLTGDGFSDDVLKVEISGPDKPELSLVDLPGLYYSTSRDQGSQGRTVVRNLVERYMQNTRSIILAVITAKSDYHLQEVLEIAENFDPKRERTIGVITQPDYLEQNSEEEDTYLQFIQNEKIKLQLGWHALRNRSSEDRDSSDDARDEKEKDFFSVGRWARISRELVGIDSLRQRLSKILLSHIKRNVPDLITDINEKICERQAKLSKLGNSRGTLQEQRAYLLSIASRFEKITGQALDGMYRDDFFGGMNIDASGPDPKRLRAIIRELNEDFAEAMVVGGGRRHIADGNSPSDDTYKDSVSDNRYLQDWVPARVNREDLEKEMKEQARQNRGIELPGSANQLLVGNLFRDQTKPWEGLAKLHLKTTWECVKDYLELLLQHLADDHTYPMILSAVLDPAMERIKDDLFHKLQELNSYNTRGHPLPFGKRFLESLLNLRVNRDAKKLEAVEAQSSVTNLPQGNSSEDQFATSEIIDFMQAYYNIAITNFVENVAVLAVENCLLLPLETIFTSLTVNNMDDTQIRRLASEPHFVQSDRALLHGELEKLQAGLRAFSRYNTYKKRTKDWNKLVKPAQATPPQVNPSTESPPASVPLSQTSVVALPKPPGNKVSPAVSIGQAAEQLAKDSSIAFGNAPIPNPLSGISNAKTTSQPTPGNTGGSASPFGNPNTKMTPQPAPGNITSTGSLFGNPSKPLFGSSMSGGSSSGNTTSPSSVFGSAPSLGPAFSGSNPAETSGNRGLFQDLPIQRSASPSSASPNPSGSGSKQGPESESKSNIFGKASPRTGSLFGSYNSSNSMFPPPEINTPSTKKTRKNK